MGSFVEEFEITFCINLYWQCLILEGCGLWPSKIEGSQGKRRGR